MINQKDNFESINQEINSQVNNNFPVNKFFENKNKIWIIAIIAFAVIIMIIGGILLFFKVSNNKQKLDMNQEIIGLCQENDPCCNKSIEIASKNNYELLLDDYKECPEGFKKNMLRCESSLKWCEPIQVEDISNRIKDRYTDFPYFKKEGNRVELDVIEPGAFIEQHPRISDNTIYLTTVEYGQIPVNNKNNLEINCEDLFRVEGILGFIDLDPTDTAVGKKSYERNTLVLEKVICIDNFLDPKDWHEFKVENSKFQGYIINPFPEKIKFELDFSEVDIDQKIVLGPYEKKEIDKQLICDKFSFGVDGMSEEWILGKIIPGGWKSDYSIFAQNITVEFLPKDCPTKPKLSLDHYIDLESIKVGEKFKAVAKVKNTGFFPADNVEFYMDYDEENIKCDDLNNQRVKEIINDLGFGEEKEFIYEFESIKAGNANVYYMLKHDSIKRDWTAFDFIEISDPRINFSVNVDAKEKKFKNGKAEFVVDMTNIGNPEFFQFFVKQNYTGNYIYDFLFYGENDSTIPWKKQKSFESGENKMMKIIIYEDRIKKTEEYNVKEKYELTLKIIPKSDETKTEYIYLTAVSQ